MLQENIESVSNYKTKKFVCINLLFYLSVNAKTEEFLVNISKNMDGKTFTLLIKFLNELR